MNIGSTYACGRRSTLLGLSLLLCPLQLAAEFTLNFTPNANIVSNIANVHCTTGGGDGVQPSWISAGNAGMNYYGCGGGYFIQEVVEDPILGGFFHVVIGDPNTDEFAQEFYIAADATNYNSASGGDWNNAHDPLGDSLAVTGNGTGNPKKIYMRQINNGFGFTQDFIKSSQTQKPLIIQDVTDAGMLSEFTLDMSNSNYDQINLTGSATNKLTLLGSEIPAELGNFDMATDIKDQHMTAGRYVYVDGGGVENSSGSYGYDEGDFDVLSENWTSYCNPGDNPDHSCDFNRGGGGGMMGW